MKKNNWPMNVNSIRKEITYVLFKDKYPAPRVQLGTWQMLIKYL